MKFNQKIQLALLSLCLICFTQNINASPDVKLSALSALPGESGELSLTVSNNFDMAGIEFQVTFDDSQVSIGTPSNGVDLTSVHTLTSYSISSSSVHILVYPDPSNNLVPNGQVVKLPVTLLTGATGGNKILTVSQAQLANTLAATVIPERVTSGLLVDPNGTTTDSDGDGMPDVFEVANNFHPLDERDAALDFDNDGLTNLAEYIGGTDPLVPNGSAYADNEGEFDSVQTIGMAWGNGYYADIINNIHVDANDNVYQAGAYRSTLDFDPSAGIDSKTSGTYNDAFVSKANATGGYEWTWTTFGYYGAYATNVATDSQGNVYVSGYFSGLTDFDPDPAVTVYKNSRSSWDMFYAKLNASGQLQWVNAFYYWGTGNEYAQDIAVDSQGNLYITGYFDGSSIDFDPSAMDDYQDRLGYPTFFLSKLDSNGIYQWTQRAGASNASISVVNLLIDSNDNITVGGKYSGTVNFDANDADNNGDYLANVSNGSDDIFVMQYAGTGIVNWLYTVGTSNYDDYRALALGGSDIVLITEMYDPVDFNSAGSGDIQGNANRNTFMTKLNINGNYGSTQILLESIVSSYMAVAVNQLGNVFIGGTFYHSNIDVNPDPAITETISPTGMADIFLLKYDINSNYLWTKTVGGFRNEIIKGLEFNSTGDLYMGGTFDTYQSTVDFDPGPGLVEKSSNGSEDIFLLKFKAAQ